MSFKPSKAFRELARWAKYQAELCELKENQHVCLGVPPEEFPQISTYDFDSNVDADIGVPTSGSVGKPFLEEELPERATSARKR